MFFTLNRSFYPSTTRQLNLVTPEATNKLLTDLSVSVVYSLQTAVSFIVVLASLGFLLSRNVYE